MTKDVPYRGLPPSLDDFEALSREAFEALPPEFRERCRDVVVQVADFADDETLDALGMESPFELTGLYRGNALTERSFDSSLTMPDEVWLYRRAILDEWSERGDVPLDRLVRHVLVHEIGHHFGLSDADMHAIEDAAC